MSCPFLQSYILSFQKHIMKTRNDKLKSLFDRTVHIIFILIIPMTVYVMFFSSELVEVIFGRGAFDNNSIKITTIACFYFSIGLVGYSFIEILSRFFYAIHEIKIPMVVSVFTMILNIILNVSLSAVMGIGGLALATSISSIVGAGTLYYFISKKIEIGKVRETVIFVIKVVIASMLCCLNALTLYNMIGDFMNQFMKIGVSFITFAITYYVTLHFLKIELIVEIPKNVFLDKR